jgi:hypothetical protein
MTEHIERHSDKLLREWDDIQQKEFWALLAAAWEKLESQAIEFTLSTHGYETILRSRGEVDGIRKAARMAKKIAEDIKAGKQG